LYALYSHAFLCCFPASFICMPFLTGGPAGTEDRLARGDGWARGNGGNRPTYRMGWLAIYTEAMVRTTGFFRVRMRQISAPSNVPSSRARS
jgi:hypothetical protein